MSIYFHELKERKKYCNQRTWRRDGDRDRNRGTDLGTERATERSGEQRRAWRRSRSPESRLGFGASRVWGLGRWVGFKFFETIKGPAGYPRFFAL